MEGRGRIILYNGDVFEGSFLNGEFNGQGTLLKKDGIMLKGNWIKGFL
jgi:hypothetical protein